MIMLKNISRSSEGKFANEVTIRSSENEALAMCVSEGDRHQVADPVDFQG